MEPSNLYRSVQRLRSVGWASAAAAILSSWGVAYHVSAVHAGTEELGALLLNVAILLASVLLVFDVTVRLYHCRAVSDLRMRHRCSKIFLLRRFRRLPTPFIDDGHLVLDANTSVFLPMRKSVFLHDVLHMAKEMQARTGVLTRADAVNLRLFASLRKRQLHMGWMTA